MAQVIITRRLREEIEKKFKGESIEIFELLLSVEEHPQKGKALGTIGDIVIKELKYKGFRFYFIADHFRLKFLSDEDLQNIIIKFVRMSDKKAQQKVIEEIKHVLRNMGLEGF